MFESFGFGIGMSVCSFVAFCLVAMCGRGGGCLVLNCSEMSRIWPKARVCMDAKELLVMGWLGFGLRK